jgi:tRNA(fMet)-specific endonuclease VapC
MRVLIDTNRYSDFIRNDPAAVVVMQDAEEVFVPFVVLAELRVGFLGGSRALSNEAILTKLLALPRVQVLYPDQETTHHYAALVHQLRRQGTPIPSNDLWIAALAVQHGLVLHARDRHFDHFPQIARV